MATVTTWDRFQAQGIWGIPVIETTWHATQKIKQHPDGTAMLSFRVDGLDEILWWVLGWSGRVQVIKPVELSKMFVTQLQAALAANQK